MELNFLTAQEKQLVNVINANPARVLTVVESIVKRLVDGDSDQALLEDIKRYVDNGYHQEKLRDVVGDRSLLPSLLETHPIVKYHDAIFNGNVSQFVKLGVAASNSKADLGPLLGVINRVKEVVEQLPVVKETFVATPCTRYDKLRNEYNLDKDPKYLGLVVKEEIQSIINTECFREGKKPTWDAIEKLGLLNNREIYERFKMSLHQRKDGYQTVLCFESPKINNHKTPVLIARVVNKGTVVSTYWFVLPR